MDTSSAAAWLQAFAHDVEASASMLTDLDRQIGDADHGSNLDRGMRAVASLAPEDFEDAGAYLKKAGMTLVSTVGGASGPLYGTFLLRFAAALTAGAPAQGSPDDAVVAAWRAGLDGVVSRGKAGPGDKTMVDALQPAVEAMEDGSGTLAERLAAGAQAAARGRDATTELVARKGRASYLGQRSAGHPHPGATSMTMLIEAAARSLA